MILEEVIEEIKKMFWGVLKGQFSPDEEEDIKTRLITALAQLTAYAKTVLPIEQQEQYELQFSKAKDILLKFDSAGPWFQELPEMVNTVYNVITYASMLQIECRRHNAVENEVVQYFNQKIEMLELAIENLKKHISSLTKKLTYEKLPTALSPEKEVTDKEGAIVEEIKETSVKQPETQKTEEAYESIRTDEDEEQPISVATAEMEDKTETEEQPSIISEEITTTEPETEEQPSIISEEITTTEPETVSQELSNDTKRDAEDLIEGIEIMSQYETKTVDTSLESEQQSLTHLAKLLSALSSEEDNILSPLTERLIALDETPEEISITQEEPLLRELEEAETEDMTDEELEGIRKFRESVERISKALVALQTQNEAANFVSTIKETIANVSHQGIEEVGQRTKLTKIIEEETGETTTQSPVNINDIENIIQHLEMRRTKTLERIQQLEQALVSEKIDEEELQDLMIKTQKHLLRIEDTLDGYKRYLEKLKKQVHSE
ncbi:MAG: hypothetical protein ACTSYD_07860 [Candidatus Heimdallarchaeaceae archaeon]